MDRSDASGKLREEDVQMLRCQKTPTVEEISFSLSSDSRVFRNANAAMLPRIPISIPAPLLLPPRQQIEHRYHHGRGHVRQRTLMQAICCKTTK